MESNPSNAKPRTWKSRFFQFGLRSLLVLVTIVGCVLGFWIVPSERQKKNVAAVNTHGAVVIYFGDSEKDVMDEAMLNQMPAMRKMFPNRPAAKGKSWLPTDYIDSPRSVKSFFFSEVDDETLKAIGRLRTLRSVKLRSGEFSKSGFRELEKLSSLEELEFASPFFSKGFAISDDELASLAIRTKLRKINLSALKGVATDAGVAQLSKLKELSHLEVRGDIRGHCFEQFLPSKFETLKIYGGWATSNVDDIGASHIAKFRSLTTLTLRNSSLTKSGVQQLATLPNLHTLDLSGSKKVSGGFAEFASTQRMISLNLEGTTVADDTAEVIGKMTSLRELQLGSTKITDEGIAYLSGLTQLTDLGLENLPITDQSMAHLRDFKSLQSLNLSGTKITDAAIPAICALTSLDSISLSDGITESGRDAISAAFNQRIEIIETRLRLGP